MPRQFLAFVFVLGGSFALVNCGGTVCSFQSLNLSPTTASISVGTSQQFLAFGNSRPMGCAAAASNLSTVTWSVSDAVNTTLSNTNGTATVTCVGHTSTSVTVTATLSSAQNHGHTITGAASLTCN